MSAKAKRSSMVVKMGSFTGYCRDASREDLGRVKCSTEVSEAEPGGWPASLFDVAWSKQHARGVWPSVEFKSSS